MCVGSVCLPLLGLGGCGSKAQEAAEGKPEPVADTAAAQMIGLGKGHVDKFMNYTQTAAMRNKHADPKEILGRPGEKYAPARAFRKDLTQMVLHAWDIPPGSPTIAGALSGK